MDRFPACLLLAALLAALASPATAGWRATTPQAEAAVASPRIAAALDAAMRFDRAILEKDVATFASLFTDDAVVNNPFNRIARKADAVRNIETGLIDYTSLERSVEFAAERGAHEVLLMGEETLDPVGKAKLAGKHLRRRTTEIWTDAGGRWQLSVRQATIFEATETGAAASPPSPAPPSPPPPPPSPPPVPGQCSEPANGDPDRPGCWLSATVAFTPDVAEVYWHVMRADDDAAARAEAARHAVATVFRAHGATWLHVVGPRDADIRHGLREATAGPLRVESGAPTTARFMESLFPPGMRTRTHAHGGPEAFFVLEGDQCVETPAVHRVLGAGDTHVVDGGPHLQASRDGRRSLVLILSPASSPWMRLAPEWVPAGACA